MTSEGNEINKNLVADNNHMREHDRLINEKQNIFVKRSIYKLMGLSNLKCVNAKRVYIHTRGVVHH